MTAASRTYGTDQGREIVRYLRTAYRAFAFDRLHVLDRPPTVTVTAPAAWLDSAEGFLTWDCSCDGDPGEGPHQPHCDRALPKEEPHAHPR